MENPSVNLNFYTEIGTGFIYEVTFFEDFVLVRPATPAYYSAIRKLDLMEFLAMFEEYWGNKFQIRNYLDNDGQLFDDIFVN